MAITEQQKNQPTNGVPRYGLYIQKPPKQNKKKMFPTSGNKINLTYKMKKKTFCEVKTFAMVVLVCTIVTNIRLSF